MSYGNTSYGGQGGGGGGGYTKEPSSSQGAGKLQTLRPVTIKQLNDATQSHPDADFRIDGADIGTVCFVGLVRNITNLTTFITYKLDDGTGELDVKVWPDKDDPSDMDPMDIIDGGGGGDQQGAAARKNQVVVNGYAKVVGKVASFNNRRNVTAMFVRPITDLNEFHYHFIEATAAHLYFSRGPPGNKQQAGGAGAGAGAAGGDATTSRGGKVLPSMSPLARKMYETLANTPQSNEGLHVQHLATEIGVPVNDILRAAEELKDLGQIYPTVDENTWAVLDFY